jgi:DNA primase
VVEGYTDVLGLHQTGVEDAVAVCGTAITPEQLAMLGGLTEAVTLALDADRAGQDAMVRAQRVAGAKRLELSIAEMPEGRDPADMVSGGSAEEFRTLVDSAVDLPTHQVRTILDRAELGSAAGRDRALGEVAPVLAALGESVSQDELVRLTADRLDTSPALVSHRVSSAGSPRDGDGQRDKAPAVELPAASPRERRERALLAMCVASPTQGRGYLERLAPEHLSSPATGRAVEWLKEHLDDPLSGLPREDEELVSLITQIVMTSEREPATSDSMELNYLQLEQRRVEDLISQASAKGEDQRLAELSRGRAELVERIAHAERTTS